MCAERVFGAFIDCFIHVGAEPRQAGAGGEAEEDGQWEDVLPEAVRAVVGRL